jgi:hypothetical protein
VSITVNPVNDPPVADDQSVSTDEDTAVEITLTASDVDGDPLTFGIVTAPAHGALSGAAPNVTYTPDADYHGPDSFTFRANDGVADSNLAAVSITVDPVNDAPVADDQSVSTDQDTPLDVTLTASDVDGDPLTFTTVTGPSHGTLSGTAPDVTYTPDAGYDGPDSLTFRANDGVADSNLATVSITVQVAGEADLWAVEYRYGEPFPGYSLADWPILESWLNVRIENRGTGDAYNVTATVTGWPDNVHVPDPDVTVGDIPAGSAAWSVDTFTIRVNLSRLGDPCEGIVWRVEYDDAAGVHHVIEDVPEFPPGEGPCGS